MANVSITEAINEWGKSRSTINRYISNGKLSAKKTNGRITIDSSELVRVFGEAPEKNNSAHNSSDVSGSNQTQDDVISILKDQIADLKSHNESLTDLLKEEQKNVKLLTHTSGGSSYQGKTIAVRINQFISELVSGSSRNG